MTMSLEAAAQKIKQFVESASVIRIWGANVFPPSDVTYEVVGASFHGEDLLRIHLFLAMDDTKPTIEIEIPKGLKIDKGALRIKEASAVRWNGKKLDKGDDAATALYLGD